MSTTTTRRTTTRTTTDPFQDQIVLPTLHKSNRQRAPVPQPRMSAATATRPTRDNMLDAVRDTVTVTSRDQSSPRRIGRSQTGMLPSATAPQTRGVVSKPTRSQSQDSVTQAAAAVERAKSKNGRPKKASQHSDVIDRLDFTGVGPMFHHDGPFDACAPSRNRHRTKAPMLAWSGGAQDPLAASSNDSAYPSPAVYKNTFSNNYYDPPKKKVDAIAEAWGTHEPEPFEDFSAGGGTGRADGDTPNSSIYKGREGSRRPKETREMREVYKEYVDESQQQQQQPRRPSDARRPTLPPPQPIFVPSGEEADIDQPLASPPIGSPRLGGDAPRRNRSIMQRIRKMRDSPNVPLGDGADMPMSPNYDNFGQSQPPRATHRSQNSFLGRFNTSPPLPKENISPTAEYFDRTKALPATPGIRIVDNTPLADQEGLGYFDQDEGTSGGYGISPGGMQRKTSLLNKVKNTVRGPK